MKRPTGRWPPDPGAPPIALAEGPRRISKTLDAHPFWAEVLKSVTSGVITVVVVVVATSAIALAAREDVEPGLSWGDALWWVLNMLTYTAALVCGVAVSLRFVDGVPPGNVLVTGRWVTCLLFCATYSGGAASQFVPARSAGLLIYTASLGAVVWCLAWWLALLGSRVRRLPQRRSWISRTLWQTLSVLGVAFTLNTLVVGGLALGTVWTHAQRSGAPTAEHASSQAGPDSGWSRAGRHVTAIRSAGW